MKTLSIISTLIFISLFTVLITTTIQNNTAPTDTEASYFQNVNTLTVTQSANTNLRPGDNTEAVFSLLTNSEGLNGNVTLSYDQNALELLSIVPVDSRLSIIGQRFHDDTVELTLTSTGTVLEGTAKSVPINIDLFRMIFRVKNLQPFANVTVRAANLNNTQTIESDLLTRLALQCGNNVCDFEENTTSCSLDCR